MKRALLLALTAVMAFDAPANAQDVTGLIPAAFDAIAGSVIQIRTVTDIQYKQIDSSTGKPLPARPYSIDGTGVVIGEMMVSGRREYLVLTNHHVADASNYVLKEDGYLRMNPRNTAALPSVREESYLVDRMVGDDALSAARLIEIVRWVEGDMALMRTDGIDRELTVFTGMIGYADGEIEAGARVLTSGYPWGGRKIIASGQILEVSRRHELGVPHFDFVVDLPVEPGQSGGPIFLVEFEDGRTTFRLVGLVHAKDDERNYGVTYRSWGGALQAFPAELRGRLVGL